MQWVPIDQFQLGLQPVAQPVAQVAAAPHVAIDFYNRPQQQMIVVQQPHSAVPQQPQQPMVLMPMQVVPVPQPNLPQHAYLPPNAVLAHTPQPATVLSIAAPQAAQPALPPQKPVDARDGGHPAPQGQHDPKTRDVADRSVVLKASSGTPAVGLAGAIAKRLRTHPDLMLEAMGPSSVTLSMRAIILAQCHLQAAKVAFTATPVFKNNAQGIADDENQTHASLVFVLTRRASYEECQQKVMPKVIEVKNQSIVRKVAGALARVMRASYRRDSAALRNVGTVTTISLGSTATTINTGTKALALARAMVDEDGKDFHIIPILHPHCGDPAGIETSTHPLLFTVERCEKRVLTINNG